MVEFWDILNYSLGYPERLEMASLYIKDGKMAERATQLARRLGTTKTDVVRKAFEALEEKLGPENTKPDFLAWLIAHRRDNPLPPPTGLKADKAFFDEMWDEEP